MMNKRSWLISGRAFGNLLIAALMGGGYARGQVLTLTEDHFNEYVTFYVSAWDISTGAMNFDWFEYRLSAESYPVEVYGEFEVLINSPALGLTYDSLFWSEVTEPFSLEGPARIQNTDGVIFSWGDAHTRPLFYSGGILVGQEVDVTIDTVITMLGDPDFDNFFGVIIQSGRLPDGTYRFNLRFTGSENAVEVGKAIVSAPRPAALELISPGGWLGDTTNTAIATTYPFFQWESDPCAVCSYQIRVAKYIAGEHNSLDDAIEDQTVWPLDQALGFYNVGNATSVQYPLTGAVDLEPGGIYVWQVQKVIPTTAGDELINSYILAFKIFKIASQCPKYFLLGDIYPNPFSPNPFNPGTEIRFFLARETDISLVVIDIFGRQVALLLSGLLGPGRYQVRWEGRNQAGESVTSGIYLCRLVTPISIQTKKMVLLK